MEAMRRLLSIFGGVIFGLVGFPILLLPDLRFKNRETQGWLVFIDSIVVYNTCRHYLPNSDPCDWGVVQNSSIPPGSVQPPQPFGGWKVRERPLLCRRQDAGVALKHLRPCIHTALQCSALTSCRNRPLRGRRRWSISPAPSSSSPSSWCGPSYQTQKEAGGGGVSIKIRKRGERERHRES